MAVYRDIEGAVVILVDEQDRIAMQLRDDKPGLPAANQWGLFGGLVQAGEDARAIALREIQEELDVRLNPEKLSLYRKHYIPEQNLTTWVFTIRWQTNWITLFYVRARHGILLAAMTLE